MIVNASCIQDVFDAVKHDKHKSEDKTVIIFVANGDVDSVCTHMQLEVREARTAGHRGRCAMRGMHAVLCAGHAAWAHAWHGSPSCMLVLQLCPPSAFTLSTLVHAC